MNSKNYFNEVADQWDTMRSSFFPESVREKIYSLMEMSPDKMAADIGAGTGFLTEGLAQNGLQVIAVDFSTQMLKAMESKFERFDHITYRQGESADLPIPSNTVDYAVANMYLHHVKDPLAAIKEMVRITKSRGSVILTDLDEHSFEFLKVEHHDEHLGFKRTDIRAWFEEAGLKNVTINCIGADCHTTSCSENTNASISIFIAKGDK